MRKWILISIIMFWMVSIVSAINIYCEDQITEDESCLMITPILNCATYDIINGTLNATGGGDLLVNDANLTVLNEKIYYLNFSQVVGEYTVRLCDNTTTREIRVVEKSKMAWTPVVLALSAMTFIFGLLSFSIKNKKLNNIKVLFFLWATINAFSLGLIGLAITLNQSDTTTFYPVAIGYFILNAAGMIAFIYMFMAYLIRRAMSDKEEDFE